MLFQVSITYNIWKFYVTDLDEISCMCVEFLWRKHLVLCEKVLARGFTVVIARLRYALFLQPNVRIIQQRKNLRFSTALARDLRKLGYLWLGYQHQSFTSIKYQEE